MEKKRKNQLKFNMKLNFQDSQLAMPYCLATIALVIQIFLPCFFANKVISFSSELSMRAYESNWIEMARMHIKFQKCFFILFECLNRDDQVTIGMVFPLSLTTFTSVSNIPHRRFEHAHKISLVWLWFQIVNVAYRLITVL